MIHVCLALCDKTGHYSKFTGTTILSLLENTKEPSLSITVHILHDNTLTAENRDKLAYVVERYDQIVKFYNVEELCPEKIAEIKQLCARVVKMRFTIATFYRLFIHHILAPDIDKIIYFDSDIIANLDIKELWEIDLGENVLGVILRRHQKINPPEGDNYYFNAGVLLINVPAFRNEEANLKNTLKLMAEKSPSSANDQELLNYYFEKRTLHLPVKFNRLIKWERRQKATNIYEKIYHCSHADSVLGLGLDMSDLFNRLWMSYFIKTPWFDADSIGRIYSEFKKINNSFSEYTLKISATVSNRVRAFYVEPKKLDAMKKHFLIRDDEEVILAENEDSIPKLIESMKASKKKKVFFILTEELMKKKFPFKRLVDEGFVNGKDFVKGWELLSTSRGEPFNTYPFINFM
ncbi:MAG: hypothetical protein SR3Q1_01820 [Quinella sp. 3Q1]|nr:hypothetical protein [Quinella sp. 3Q1]MBR6887906.1 hypothetical protein [Selenomonadaceae bacterium]